MALTIDQMNKKHLKSVLTDKGLSTTGAKADLLLRLEQHLRDNNEDPAAFTYTPEEVSTDDDLKAILSSLHANLKLISDSQAQLQNDLKLVNDGQAEVKNDLKLVNDGQAQVQNDIKVIKESQANTDTKIDAIKVELLKEVGLVQDRVAQLEVGMKDNSDRITQNSDRIVQHSDKITQMESKLDEQAGKCKDLADKVDNLLLKGENPTKYQLVSGPDTVVDARMIKDSLPEFHGRLEEDPAKFISDAVGLLKQTNWPEQIFIKLLSQQLKGPAFTWWQNLRGLHLDWKGFQEELLLRFDSEAVKANAQKKFFTETQPSGMRAGAFVIQKYQLFKRLHPKSNGDEAVHHIIETLGDKIRPLVKVAAPKSFTELREVVRQLEEEHRSSTTHTKKELVPNQIASDEGRRKCFKCGRPGHLQNKCSQQGN